jgi:hypothetical protein
MLLFSLNLLLLCEQLPLGSSLRFFRHFLDDVVGAIEQNSDHCKLGPGSLAVNGILHSSWKTEMFVC